MFPLHTPANYYLINDKHVFMYVASLVCVFIFCFAYSDMISDIILHPIDGIERWPNANGYSNCMV